MNRSAGPLQRACLLLTAVFLTFLLAACSGTPPKKGGFTPEQIAAMMELGFKQSDEGWEYLAADNLLFATGEYKLTPAAQQMVERIGKRLAAVEILRVRVDGHTDAQGSDSANQKLSERRAAAVADALVAAGLPNAGVAARGLGESRPLASNLTPEGRAQNRRVAIVALEE